MPPLPLLCGGFVCLFVLRFGLGFVCLFVYTKLFCEFANWLGKIKDMGLAYFVLQRRHYASGTFLMLSSST